MGTPLEKISVERDSRVLPPLVAAMMRPAFYPEPPDKVELLQTHISYVFIAGAFVYKLKKPVRFSFLDCTDLERRRHFCAEEIRLNRRLAPDVYLGLYPIIRAASGYLLGEQSPPHDEAVDYVLKMRRLPNEGMLDRKLTRGEVDRATIRRLASIIVDFYRTSSPAHAAQYASTAELWRLIVGELADVEHLVGATITAQELGTIESFCRKFIASHWRMLNARVAAGRVREGHGDLRCEHICVEDDKVSIFDCVEFSERLRTCDLASELGFLAMDLDRLGAPELADELVGEIVESAQDQDLPRLMPFYKCYRAVIRGVVESLRSREVEIGDAERKSAAALATRYFTLARSYAIDAAPIIIVICGLSGSGKSTVAKALQHRLGFPVISTDRTRKELAAVPPERHPGDAYKSGIYTDAVTESTYAAMIERAGDLLKDATGVILDGTFQDPRHRKQALELAARSGVKILFVECQADDAEIRRRLMEREKTSNDPSDATVAVYLRQREDFVALSEIPVSGHLNVSTTRPIGEIVSAVKNAMEQLRL